MGREGGEKREKERERRRRRRRGRRGREDRKGGEGREKGRGREIIHREREGEEGCIEGRHIIWQTGTYTLSLRLALAPALRRDSVVLTSPFSAQKKRADHPVLCDGGISIICHTITTDVVWSLTFS